MFQLISDLTFVWKNCPLSDSAARPIIARLAAGDESGWEEEEGVTLQLYANEGELKLNICPTARS